MNNRTPTSFRETTNNTIIRFVDRLTRFDRMNPSISRYAEIGKTLRKRLQFYAKFAIYGYYSVIMEGKSSS